MKNQYIVAIKDVSSGEIRPGKVLGQYRRKEFADRDQQKLARRAGCEYWHVGIFFQDKLVS